MSRLKAMIDAPYERIRSKKIMEKLCRTDHIICKKMEDQYYIWCKYIPTHVGHLYSFNPDYWSIQYGMRRATTDWKTQNFKKRLKTASKAGWNPVFSHIERYGIPSYLLSKTKRKWK